MIAGNSFYKGFISSTGYLGANFPVFAFQLVLTPAGWTVKICNSAIIREMFDTMKAAPWAKQIRLCP